LNITICFVRLQTYNTRDLGKRWGRKHSSDGIFRTAGDDEAEWEMGMGSHFVYEAEDMSLLFFFDALVESVDYYDFGGLRGLGLEAPKEGL
jgi:hypothetical protein